MHLQASYTKKGFDIYIYMFLKEKKLPRCENMRKQRIAALRRLCIIFGILPGQT